MRDPCDDIYESILFGIDRRTLYMNGTANCVKHLTIYFNRRYGTNFVFLGEDGISDLYILCDLRADSTLRAIFLGVIKQGLPMGVKANLVEVSE